MKVEVTAENYEEIVNKLTIVNTSTFSNGI